MLPHDRHLLTLASALSAACAVTQTATAQRSGGDGDRVETILVTDSAPTDQVELVPGGATLLDGEELRQRNMATLADLLRYVPGVWSASAYGTDSMFFSSRGSNLDATDYDMNGILLLQDGLPVTTADGNNHNRVLDPLSARFATVARGANAVRYGASTLGGAIELLSPTARNSAPMEVFANTGSHGQLLVRGTFGGMFGEGADALVTLETKRWDGYRDHNEQRREGLYANAGWEFSDGAETRFFLTHLDNDQELPGSLTRNELLANPDQASSSALTGNFQIDVETLRLANKTSVQIGSGGQLDFGFSLEDQTLYHPIVDVRLDFDGPGGNPPVQVFSLLVDTDHLNTGAMLRYSREAGDHSLTFGLHYGRSTINGGDYWNQGGRPEFLMTTVDNSATTTTLYALDRWQVADRVLLELGAQAVAAERDVLNVEAGTGVRNNPRDDFSRLNPRIGLIYRASDGVDLFANLSSLYEPPTTFELQEEASGIPNTILDAMTGTVVELGTRGSRDLAGGKRLGWEVALYYAAIDDEILSIDDRNAPGTSLSANIDDTTHAGIEASFGAELPLGANGGALAPRLSFTLNEFSFDGDPVYGDNELPAAPGYVLRGELLYRHASGFYVGPTFDFVDERFADFANTYRVDSYELLGLRAGWTGERWQVFAEAVNLADEKYVATVGVRDIAAATDDILNPGAPRSFYVGLQGRF
jgi:iron complex outermembrane receptor protein